MFRIGPSTGPEVTNPEFHPWPRKPAAPPALPPTMLPSQLLQTEAGSEETLAQKKTSLSSLPIEDSIIGLPQESST